MIMSAVMHWLVSQSIFLAHIYAYNELGEEYRPYDVLTLGYSTIAAVLMMTAGGLMLVTIFLFGARKYRPGMPFAMHCSAVISAACHRSVEDYDIAIRPVQWGIVSEVDGIAHCAFSSFEISLLENG